MDYKIVIDNSENSNTLTDYQVKVTITDPAFFSKCTEQKFVEFYDEDKTTLLNHWTEKFDPANNEAIFWVKVPNIPANSTKTIFLNINTSRTEDLSSGKDTFDFFDDFEEYTEGDLNGQGGWSGSPYHDVETVNPYKGAKHVRANVGGGDYKITHPCPFSKNFVISVMAYSHSGSQGGLFLFDDAENNLLAVDPDDEWGRLDLYYDGSWHFLSGEQITGKYVEIKIVVKEDKADLYYNGELKAGNVGWSGTIAKFGFFDWQEITDYDLLIVRKYTEPEPTVSVIPIVATATLEFKKRVAECIVTENCKINEADPKLELYDSGGTLIKTLPLADKHKFKDEANNKVVVQFLFVDNSSDSYTSTSQKLKFTKNGSEYVAFEASETLEKSADEPLPLRWEIYIPYTLDIELEGEY